MLNNKSILVVVPARGGSKGVKLKNIRMLNGIPLIGLTGKVVKELVWVDRAVVSTDHSEIAKIAVEWGLEAPFVRSEELSGDTIGDVDVLTEALLKLENLDCRTYDVIVMLQPTSPFRTAKHVKDAVQLLLDTNADSVWTLSLSDSKAHPYKQLLIINNEVEFYDSAGERIIARQQLFPTYHKNGIAYVMTRDCLINQKSIRGHICKPLIIEDFAINIDTELDIEFSEFVFQKYYS
jgi:CMP-N,N'-diacetyllegionaminic acid synthase